MVDMGILVNTLIIVSVVMFIATSLFESSVLQIKMSDRFKRYSAAWCEVEKGLTKLEESIEKTGECKLPYCVLREFVPDEWFTLELSGVSYYEVQNKIQSTFALRKETVDAFQAPSLPWLNASKLTPDMIVGSDPLHEGVRLYVVEWKEGEKNNVLSVFQWCENEGLKLVYRLDENTTFGIPRLWHEMIIIEKIPEKKLAIYQAATGKKLQELILRPEALAADYPLCSIKPIVLVREARERKRKIIITGDQERWFVETELDYEFLGRRTETVGVME